MVLWLTLIVKDLILIQKIDVWHETKTMQLGTWIYFKKKQKNKRYQFRYIKMRFYKVYVFKHESYIIAHTYLSNTGSIKKLNHVLIWKILFFCRSMWCDDNVKMTYIFMTLYFFIICEMMIIVSVEESVLIIKYIMILTC